MGAMQIPDDQTPLFVMSADGLRLATYEWGDPDAPTVVAVHGFASSAIVNWQDTGWVRDLTRAGFRVIALDQRGHGSSEKPREHESYSMALLIADLLAVMDTYMIDDAQYAGYSLGARVGWQAALELPERITRAVLGGIPDGDPLTRFRVDQARAFLAEGTPVDDRLTEAYLTMAGGIQNNDLTALVALVEGMQGGVQPDPANPPGVPILFATGSDDRILEASRGLAAAAPNGSFFEIPGRNHFNAPTARTFRDAAVEFLSAG
jgi:pimeloyl-ACP methyl ester carboxylesterase